MSGWIKLHRRMLEWEWWDEPNTARVFLFLLLRVNHAPARWRGVALSPGECITSVGKLSEGCALSQQTVRTALNHLKSTGEIKVESTSRYTKVTIQNWDKYQAADTPPTTNKNPKNNQNDLQRRKDALDAAIAEAVFDDGQEVFDGHQSGDCEAISHDSRVLPRHAHGRG